MGDPGGGCQREGILPPFALTLTAVVRARAMCILIVTSEDYRGRFVGRNMADLLRVPDEASAPEIPVLGTHYSLFLSEAGATRFLETRALEVQRELRDRGIYTVLAGYGGGA
jgi:hypothetical protein